MFSKKSIFSTTFFTFLFVCSNATSLELLSSQTNHQKTSKEIIAKAFIAEKKIPMNIMHQWQVTLKDRDAKPLSGLTLLVSGGMPAHKHGMPSKPQAIEAADKPGVYIINGVKFQMPGSWFILIQDEDKNISVQFDFIVSP